MLRACPHFLLCMPMQSRNCRHALSIPHSLSQSVSMGDYYINSYWYFSQISENKMNVLGNCNIDAFCLSPPLLHYEPEMSEIWKSPKCCQNISNTAEAKAWNYQLEQHIFFAFWLIIEGATEKVLQFIMQFKLIYNKNLCFIEQKMFFEHHREVQTRKKSLNLHYFCHDNFFLVTFSELPTIGLY